MIVLYPVWTTQHSSFICIVHEKLDNVITFITNNYKSWEWDEIPNIFCWHYTTWGNSWCHTWPPLCYYAGSQWYFYMRFTQNNYMIPNKNIHPLAHAYNPYSKSGTEGSRFHSLTADFHNVKCLDTGNEGRRIYNFLANSSLESHRNRAKSHLQIFVGCWWVGMFRPEQSTGYD